MFVLKSTYERLLSEYAILVEKWTKVVNQINKRGGESFLYGTDNVFDKSDLDKLIRLCHPDRHGGRDALAEEMTSKLLAMRKKNGYTRSY